MSFYSAVINRHRFIKPIQLITDFFKVNDTEVLLIQLIYLVVTLSITPNFLLVSMIRFFQMFKVDMHAKISLKEIVYIVVVILVAFGVFVSGIDLQLIFSLNGALLGYVYIILFPIYVHFKCVFFDRSSGAIVDDEEWNSTLVPNAC